ncbi:MAG: mechanosensitive ion channel family protein, partial [Gammaproteobacteria bacterium]
QNQLLHEVDEAKNAGPDVTQEQTTKIIQLNERLTYSSASLAEATELLDTLGKDTVELKQALLSISGDITQDVLNVDVVRSIVRQWFKKVKNMTMDNGPNIIFKLTMLIIILFIAKMLSNGARKLTRKTVTRSSLNFSVLLQDFFITLVGQAVFILGILVALSQLGIELAPLLTGFGVAGIIIGFALQDTLSNFASGMMILIYRPFDVGDLIEAAAVKGKVSHMSLVSTTIKTLDNQRLIIPNNKIWGDTINNITVEPNRRVDMIFRIGYKDDIDKAEEILTSVTMSHPKVLKDPEPKIRLSNLNLSSVDFIVYPWATSDDYWDVFWDITKSVKVEFDKAGISIPYPQQDLHIHQAS